MSIPILSASPYLTLNAPSGVRRGNVRVCCVWSATSRLSVGSKLELRAELAKRAVASATCTKKTKTRRTRTGHDSTQESSAATAARLSLRLGRRLLQLHLDHWRAHKHMHKSAKPIQTT